MRLQFLAKVSTFLILLVTPSSCLLANKEYPSLETKVKNLEKKVIYLEESLKHLQRDIFKLEQRKSGTSSSRIIEEKEEIVSWGCSLKNKFKTYSSKGKSRVEATALVLQKCGFGFQCKKEDLTCESQKTWVKKYIPLTGNKVIVKKGPKKTWYCLIQNSMNRTFLGKGETKTEATASAYKICGSGFACKNKKVECDFSY